MKKKKYFIYARSAMQSKEKQLCGIDYQLKSLKKFAKESRLKVIDVFSEYGSGNNVERPEFLRMMQRLKNKEAEGILCMNWDRITKDFVIYVNLKNTFEQNDIEVITLHDELEDDFLSMFSEDFINLCHVCGSSVD